MPGIAAGVSDRSSGAGIGGRERSSSGGSGGFGGGGGDRIGSRDVSRGSGGGGRGGGSFGGAGSLAAAAPGPVVHEALPAWAAAAAVVVAAVAAVVAVAVAVVVAAAAAAVAADEVAVAAVVGSTGNRANRRNVGGKENENKTEQLIRNEDSLGRLRDRSLLRSRVSRLRGGSDESKSGNSGQSNKRSSPPQKKLPLR